MATDEEKSKIVKLLQGLEVPEVKLTERCSDLVKAFQQRFSGEVEAESHQEEDMQDLGENPYKVDRRLLEENENKLKELLAKSKRFVLLIIIYLFYEYRVQIQLFNAQCLDPMYFAWKESLSY